jgi:hypothetical protein
MPEANAELSSLLTKRTNGPFHGARNTCDRSLCLGMSLRLSLASELRKTAATVRVIARGMDTLARLFPDVTVEKWPADILDANATLRAVEGYDLAYDCIGLPGIKCICIR